ncbi:hypothetical protein [Haloferax sp. Atlit-12N]|uniref:hypothetical protein n=1 Tax=Haloferax sp. Atlit-12N TaxID=2077203 RepID=UPI0011E5C187|nr:hypothetical protein [Haloferax sp. Atlit-12N]
MARFLVADSSLIQQGHRSFLIGVALKIRNGSEFDEHYFDVVEDLFEKYDVEIRNAVLDSSTIVSRVPSFHVREARQDLIEGIVNNPAIEKIHVAIGWYLDGVEIGGRSIGARNFVENKLSQYFPVVTAWNSHRESLDWDDTPTELWLDNVQGRITKAWKYLGKEFEDLNLVPHGDTTYPSISSADIIANYLGSTLSKDKDFSELSNQAHRILSRLRDGTEGITSSDINHEMSEEDHIVPEYDYAIRPELHYPHPVFFIHDEHFSNSDQPVLKETEFHGMLRRHAQEKGGCVVGLEPHRLPAIVRNDDKIVPTYGSNTDVAKTLQKLNPTTDLEIIEAESFINEFMDSDASR